MRRSNAQVQPEELPVVPVLRVPAAAADGDLVPGALALGVASVDDDIGEWREATPGELESAIDTLRALSQPAAWVALLGAAGARAWVGSDGLSASRVVILPELWHPWPLGGVIVALPTPDHLIALALDRLGSLQALPSMVEAANLAELLGVPALSDQLFWHDGTTLHRLPLTRVEGVGTLDPPEAFLRAVGRVATLDFAEEGGAA
jgi:hypothetical protein